MHRKFCLAVALTTPILGNVASSSELAPQLGASRGNEGAVVEEKAFQGGSVSYRGVSFRYPPSLASGVKAEFLPAITLQAETDKPEGVAPDHIAFSIAGPYSSKHASSFFSPEIHIYSIAEYKKALAVSNSYVRRLEDDVRVLKSMLSRRPASWKEEIPFLPFGIDASQSFRAKVKYVDFRNGRAVSFLTQYDIEPSLINNSGLTYVFQGITDDGANYVSATFPVTAPSLRLPERYEVGSYEGYNLPAYFYGKDAELNKKNYRAYRHKLIGRLDEMPPDKYEPSLTLFEELMRSLSVQLQSKMKGP